MVLPMSLLEVSMVKTGLQTGPWGSYQKLQGWVWTEITIWKLCVFSLWEWDLEEKRGGKSCSVFQ